MLTKETRSAWRIDLAREYRSSHWSEQTTKARGKTSCLLNPGRICTNCGECDRCDLNPAKLCDNCCECLGDADYGGIIVTRIDWRNDEVKQNGQKGKNRHDDPAGQKSNE